MSAFQTCFPRSCLSHPVSTLTITRSSRRLNHGHKSLLTLYHENRRNKTLRNLRILGLDAKEAIRNSKADFTYMAAIWIPDADEEALRVVVDWLHWVFYFDDRE